MYFNEDDIDKLLNHIKEQEDKYYDYMDKAFDAGNVNAYMIHMAEASAFQRVRCVLEMMIEEKKQQEKTFVMDNTMISKTINQLQLATDKPIYDPCANCNNRPMNGEIKACFCVLPHLNTIT